MPTPLNGSGPNAVKLGGTTPGRGGSKIPRGGSATPITGMGPNGSFPRANGSIVVKNGKVGPSFKKLNLPPLGRDTAGQINLGLGNGG